ncbi:MAG: DUF1330 domain-containing protein [Flavobacteriaceae bacterium]
MKKSILISILLISVSVLLSNKVVAQEDVMTRTVLVINAVVNQEHKQELQGYLSQMMKVFKDNGGNPLGRYKTIEKIKGSRVPEMIAIVSFENAETIKKMLEGDEYKSLSELRERVFSDLKIVLCTELN